MTRYEKLQQQLFDDGVKVFELLQIEDYEDEKDDENKVRGIYTEANGHSWIFLRTGLQPRERVYTLAHEAGHHYCGVLPRYACTPCCEARIEHKAKRWAAHWLGVDSIVDAWAAGARTDAEIAEQLDIEIAQLQEAMDIFKSEFDTGIYSINGWHVEFHPTFQAWKNE